jgi:hypothetical protein
MIDACCNNCAERKQFRKLFRKEGFEAAYAHMIRPGTSNNKYWFDIIKDYYDGQLD